MYHPYGKDMLNKYVLPQLCAEQIFPALPVRDTQTGVHIHTDKLNSFKIYSLILQHLATSMSVIHSSLVDFLETISQLVAGLLFCAGAPTLAEDVSGH